MPDGWYGVAAPPELILKFLHVFSHFEYALKAAGYADDRRGHVEANWNRFGADISKNFQAILDADDAAPAFTEAVEYLLARPPKSEVLIDGHLEWRDERPHRGKPCAKVVLNMVRRVRNNLFHGGKFLNDITADTARDQRLIESSLTILSRCVKLVNKVQHADEE